MMEATFNCCSDLKEVGTRGVGVGVISMHNAQREEEQQTFPHQIHPNLCEYFFI
jgi:hypothetical protein